MTAKGAKVGVLRVRLYRPFSIGRLPRGPAEDDQGHRGARPHEGTWHRRRAALPGRHHGAARSARRGPIAVRGRAGRHRRPVRPVVEGIHAVDGQDGVRRGREGAAEAALHGRHHRRRHAPVARLRQGARHRAPPTSSARCSSAWAPTARSARTRTPSRSSARRRTTSRRATSCTTRRSRARSPSRTCGSARGRSARRTS